MTVQELRDELRGRAEAVPPANPARPAQVRARIRRRRLRRSAVAGVVVAALASAGFLLFPGTAQRPPDHTAVAVQPPPPLPESFTAPDGTAYRRVGATSMRASGKERITIKVPYTGKPLDVAGACAGEGTHAPRFHVADGPKQAGFFGRCSRQRQLQPLHVPKSGSAVEIVFDARTSGTACTRSNAHAACVPQQDKPTEWSLAVYEWTPPPQPVVPDRPRDLPSRLDGWKLEESRSGSWPEDGDSVTFDVTGDGGKLGVDQICTGDLAGRLRFSLKVNGEDTGSSGDCGVWEDGAFPSAMNEIEAPAGRRVTITISLDLRGEHTNRPVRWSVGLYRK